MNAPHTDQDFRDHILERIAQADNTPAQLAAELSIDLAELSRWILNPDNLRLVEGVARLSDVRAQMILSRYRATTAAHLIAIAAAADPSEISRKACVDLLTTDLEVFTPDDTATTDRPTQPAPTEQTMLATLARLAEEADARNDEEYDPGNVPVPPATQSGTPHGPTSIP
jgi:hypothetical protein